MRYSKENEKKINNKELLFDTIDKMPTISEWFISLEGEGNSIGEPSLYIRLNGCYSAKCSWCDSKYSWFLNEGNNDLDKIGKDIIKEIANKDIKRLTITGGEPLHFINKIEAIVTWLEELGITFNFIGIESNGNLLQYEKNTTDVLKVFNTIKLKYGIIPTLTISPKLDAEACYGNLLSQQEIWNMYDNVIKNCFNYLDINNVYFKFVWEYSKENTDNLRFIKIIKEYGIPRKHIMLMPWTPNDPHGQDSTEWKKSQMITSRNALKLGIKYSPRLHIDILMD